MRKKPTAFEIVLGLSVLGGVIYYGAGFARVVAERQMPQDQRIFVDIVAGAQSLFKNSNEIAQNFVRNKRKSEICDAPVYLQVRDWVGEIEDIKSTFDGDALISIKIADDISLKSLNGSSAAASSTVIRQNNGLFKKLLLLSRGQFIKFSGTFFSDPTDCFKELSLTQRGSVTSPEFLFRVFDVSAR